VALGLLALAPRAPAATLSGVCPDGSFFVVQRRDAVPCAQPRFVDDPSELPPLRPYLLPRPYTWYVDQEARNPNNPYNLLDAAEKIRAARLGPKPGSEAAQGSGTPAPSGPPQAARLPAPAPAPAAAPTALALADDELRDLVRLIGLRQEAAPAELAISDARGDAKLRIQLAHSAAFEAWALEALRRDPGAGHVIVFAVLAEADTDFHPNFFVVQGGRTFRPDPAIAGEVGFLLGEPGNLPAGELAVGYIVVPASFDPREAMELFWNDRSVETVLAREATAPQQPS
jgi:hypothetical protein